MSSKYPLIAAAVAAAVTSGYASAAAPSIAAAAASTNTLVMSGSSAAGPAIATFVESQICGGSGNTLLVTSANGTKNFLAYSCQAAADIVDPSGSGTTITAGSVVTIYYRTEGGSVVGALPIATGAQIKRLDLTEGSCTGSGLTATCNVSGATTTSGTLDSWSGAVTPATTQLGVTDVEPSQLTNKDYPSNYAASAFGSATTAQMKALGAVPLFQQVFGLVVNTSGLGISSVDLSKEAAANILSGKYSDWSKVAGPDGNPLVTGSHPITHVDREPGSGTRTATNMYFLNYQCGSQTAISSTSGNFSTGDELNAANSTPGSIAYASIDNILNPASNHFPNLVLASINGVAPNTLNAATGRYDFWYEATLVPNTNTTAVPPTSTSATLSHYLQANLPNLATAPALPDINVIPLATRGHNTPTVPLTNNGNSGTATNAVYVNPYTRGGNSCNVPVEFN